MRRTLPLLLAALTLAAAACERKAQVPASPAPAPAAATPGADSDTGPIAVGVVANLTGSEATFGISTRNGVDLALKEANAEGGVRGRQLKAVVYDSRGRAEEAAQSATRLIAQDKVALILGETASGNSLAMAEKAQGARVPMITPSSTHPSVTRRGDFIFRVCFIDPFQGYAMARFAREDLRLNRVAVLQDSRSTYSVGLTDVFTRKFSEMGGSIVATESYSKGDTDFRPQLTALQRAGPEALYIPGYYTDVGLIATQARELGLTLALLGGDGWESDKLVALGGESLEGSYFSNHYAVDNPDPVLKAYIESFAEKYKAAYGGVPDSVAALAYDATRLAVDAMRRAPNLSGPALRSAIAATKDFPGVAGAINLDENHDAVKQAVILQVREGQTRFVTTVKP